MDFRCFCGRSNPAFTRDLGRALSTSIGTPVAIPCIADIFDDGEPNIRIPEDVTGADIFLVESTHTAEYFIELLAMIDAAKRSGAARVTAILPYFGYGRQDRSTGPGTPIIAALACRMLETAGADRLITIDLHAPRIADYFHGTFENISALPILLNALRADTEYDPATTALISPDAGGLDRCHTAAGIIGCPNVTFVEKRRDPRTQEVHVASINDPTMVRDRDCILGDDIVATGTTLVRAAEELSRAGARRISAVCTHSVLATERATGQRALTKISASRIERLDVADTIPLNGDRAPTSTEVPRIHVHSVATLLARAIVEFHK